MRKLFHRLLGRSWWARHKSPTNLGYCVRSSGPISCKLCINNVIRATPALLPSRLAMMHNPLIKLGEYACQDPTKRPRDGSTK
jgi:hypothetical protein